MDHGKRWSLRRLQNDSGHFAMLAIDQRPPMATIPQIRLRGPAFDRGCLAWR